MSEFDVIIVGTGAAGLFCALNLDSKLHVLIVTKTHARESNSYLAQGGITTTLDDNDKLSFIQDTMSAGQNENDISAVTLLAERSQSVLEKLSSMNMPFTSNNGELCYTREGAHSKKRIVYADDETGRHLMETLLLRVSERDNITVCEYTMMADILEIQETRECVGIQVVRNGEPISLRCRKTILACGGIGSLFKNSTNQSTVAGDALAIAHTHGIALKNLGYVQFHPTSFYENNNSGKRFLLSESMRGEGAYLLNPDKQRFVNELLPRDVVTEAIREELKKFPSSSHVYLDISHMDSTYLIKRFPAIYEKCLSFGYDLTKEPLPVTPSQHYHMGGIQVDLTGKTNMKNLYAIGEASCTGVHGANRLASNSLLEALVYGEQVAQDINVSTSHETADFTQQPMVFSELKDAEYRAELVKSLLIQENGGLRDELCYN